MPAWFVKACALFLSLLVIADDLPREMRPIVMRFERQREAAVTKAEQVLQDWSEQLLQQLGQEQRRLAVNNRLDEAIIVRDLIRDLESESPASVSTLIGELDFSKFPRTVQSVLLLQTPPAAIEQQLQRLLGKDIEATEKELLELQKKFAESDQLDEAIAVRDWIRINLRELASAEGPVTPTESGLSAADIQRELAGLRFRNEKLAAKGDDLAEIQRKLTQANAENLQRLDRFLVTVSAGLIRDLQRQQTSLTRSGAIDDAVRIRDFVKALEAEPSGNRRLSQLEAASELNSAAAAAVMQAVQTGRAARERQQEVARELGQQLREPLVMHCQELLLADDLEKSRGALSQLFSLDGKSFPYGWAGHYRQPLQVTAPLQQIIDKFAEAALPRIAAVDQQLKPRREALILELRKALQQPIAADEVVAIGRMIDFLENPANLGLRGLLLMTPETGLTADRRQAVQNLQQFVHASFAEQREEHRREWREQRPAIAAVLQQQLQAEEWESAFSSQEILLTVPHFLPPVPVKQGVWDASVLDAQDGCYLLRDLHGREVWVLRAKFQIGGEKPVASDSPELTQPGQQVTPSTRLAAGQLVLAKRGFEWQPMRVLQLGPNTVRVISLDTSAREQVFARDELRVILAAAVPRE